MPRKIRQLKADLRGAGFVLDPKRGKGSHTVWIHEGDRDIEVVLSGHDRDDARHYQEREVRDAIARVEEHQR